MTSDPAGANTERTAMTELDTKAEKSKAQDWRDWVMVHPAADLFPMMSAAELDELGADIEANGLHELIVFYRPPGFGAGKLQLLDGRNRLAAMARLGWSKSDALRGTWRLDFNDLKTDPYTYVISANIRRRHLTTKQRKELAAKLLKADPAKSDRAVGSVVKLSPKTVAAVRHEGEVREEIPHVERRMDSAGREQPAHKASGKLTYELPGPGVVQHANDAKTELRAMLYRDIVDKARFVELINAMSWWRGLSAGGFFDFLIASVQVTEHLEDQRHA